MGENLVCPACRHATRKHGRDGCDAVNGSCWCDMTPEGINAPAADPEPARAEPASIAVEVTDDDREAARAELVASQRATQEMRETDDVDEGLEDDPYGEGRDDWHDDDQGDELDGIGSQYIADPVERITELAKIAPEYVRPVEPEPPATELSLPPATFAAALDWWDSWRCRTCFSRYFTPRPCCGEQAESVRVFVVPREDRQAMRVEREETS